MRDRPGRAGADVGGCSDTPGSGQFNPLVTNLGQLGASYGTARIDVDLKGLNYVSCPRIPPEFPAVSLSQYFHTIQRANCSTLFSCRTLLSRDWCVQVSVLGIESKKSGDQQWVTIVRKVVAC